MKSFVRIAVLLVTVFISVGCVASVADSSPVDRAPENISESRVLVPTNVAPVPAVTSTIIPPPIPAAASSTALVTPRPSDGDLAAVQEPGALQKTWAAPISSPTPPALVASLSKPSQPLTGKELFVHLPPQPNAQKPLRVLLVLHGMGGSGEIFSQSLLREAERNNWLLLAPTFQYHDYMDPKQLMDDDIQFTKRILDTLDVLPQRLNLKLHEHILIYGFSRGAQLAHRFAYFYPERVESVVALSSGAYTMPIEQRSTDKGAQVLPFPYGVGDLQECVGKPVNWQALKRISFWIGVGAQDDQAGDVARAFDQYGGKTRVERAKTFQQALQSIGIDTHLVIFPNSTHKVTSQMRVSALQFLRDDELADHLDD